MHLNTSTYLLFRQQSGIENALLIICCNMKASGNLKMKNKKAYYIMNGKKARIEINV